MSNPAPAALLLPIADVCSLLGIGRTKIYELLAAGELLGVKLGSRTLIDRRSLEAFIARLRPVALGLPPRRAPRPHDGRRGPSRGRR